MTEFDESTYKTINRILTIAFVFLILVGIFNNSVLLPLILIGVIVFIAIWAIDIWYKCDRESFRRSEPFYRKVDELGCQIKEENGWLVCERRF